MLYEVDGKQPHVAETCFIAPNASVIGAVTLGENVSVWFGAIIRADLAPIEIGANTNIQDASVLHVNKDSPVWIGENVTVGHKVMLHGCTIGDGCLIGMNAVVLNGAVIGKNCLIGANALVTENMHIPDGSMVLGSPAKVVKTLSEANQARLLLGAESYLEESELYRNTLKAIDE